MPRAVEPIRVVVTNDFHHEDADCDPWMEALFRQVAQTDQADLCLALGDLANSGKRASLETMKRLSGLTGMPFYVTPGNHDFDDSGNGDDFAALFPSRQNYTFMHKGWQFVLIDSTDEARWENTTVSERTLNWLAQTVPTLDPLAPTILGTHFPLAKDVSYCPYNAEAVLAHFDDINLRGVFCGHYHANTVEIRGDYELVTCVGLARVRANHDGTTGKGYWVVDGSAEGELTRTFVPFAGG